MFDTLAKKVDPAHTALLVIDMQNEFCAEAGLRGREGDDLSAAQQLVPKVRDFIAQARRADVPIVFIQAVYNSINDQYISDVWREQDLRRRRSGRPEAQCTEGSWNAEICTELEVRPEDLLIQKRRYCAFQGTGLDMVLRARGIKTVVIAGMATEICAESTARSAFMRDYYVVFTSDVTTTFDPRIHADTLQRMNRFFGEVASADQVLACWHGHAE